MFKSSLREVCLWVLAVLAVWGLSGFGPTRSTTTPATINYDSEELYRIQKINVDYWDECVLNDSLPRYNAPDGTYVVCESYPDA